MYGTIPLPWGRIADICRLRSTKLIFVGYGQLNSTNVFFFFFFFFFAIGMYDTSYLNAAFGRMAYFVSL